MEKITNYKLKEFLELDDPDIVNQTLSILELLAPISIIKNPIKKWYNKQPKFINIKPAKTLSFGGVTRLRKLFNKGEIGDIIEAVGIVSELDHKVVNSLTVIEFYGILNGITAQLIQLSDMEVNELSDDDIDPIVLEVNAAERMSRFQTLNRINSLANDDVTKWEEIEKLPYLTVFTKLMMDKERAAIRRDMDNIQKRKQN